MFISTLQFPKFMSTNMEQLVQAKQSKTTHGKPLGAHTHHHHHRRSSISSENRPGVVKHEENDPHRFMAVYRQKRTAISDSA